jgi:hypothetical protein
MAPVHPLPLCDEFLDYVVEKASPQEILAFKASPEAQAYVQELLERNSAGALTPEEAQKLEQMVQFERMMAVLKAKALKALHRDEPGLGSDAPAGAPAVAL